LLFWTMKGREHLNCGKMDFLMLVSENFVCMHIILLGH
jgi:hypothetical protein